MTGSVAFPSIRPASRSLRASVIEMSERPFAQILLGTLLPALVLALVWGLARTLPLKAFYLAAASFGCAVSLVAMTRRRHAADIEAWLSGIRACLVVLTLPWILFLGTVAVMSVVAGVREIVVDGHLAPDGLVAFALLPAMGLVALPALSTLTVLALWSRQAWRASRSATRERRRMFAVLGLATPLTLGVAIEFVARRAETVVMARYVDSASFGDPASLDAWRPISQVHGWTALEVRCGYGEIASNQAPAPAQQRARASLAALTGFDGASSSAALD